MRKRIDVLPNNWGLIYRDNALVTVAEPGVYRYWDFTRRLSYLLVPKTPRVVQVSNQEVLTKDNIAFRFSFSAEYRFVDPKLVAQNVDFMVVGLNSPKALIELFEWRIRLALQEHYRQVLASVSAEEVNGNQGASLAELPEATVQRLTPLGVEVDRQAVGYVTFPKAIQDLFAKQLEAQIRAKTDLENARTSVAAARALKNAAELMKTDENLRYLKYLETVAKIAEKGRHTFVFGEPTTTVIG